MTEPDKQRLIKEALFERFEKHRLPRILDIKESVDAGNPLSKMDTDFLEEVIRDGLENKHYVDDSPEDIQVLFSKVIQLYKEIISKALEIEKDKSGPGNFID